MDSEELVKRFHTDDSKLSPEAREIVERNRARIRELREQGRVAPPDLVARANFPIGFRFGPDGKLVPSRLDSSGDDTEDRAVKPGDDVEDLSW